MWKFQLTCIFSVEKNLRLGMKSLDQPESRGFNLNRALFLLFLSTLMYEREEKKVSEAHDLLSKVDESTNCNDINKICKLLREAEAGISEQIKKFNLQFSSLSELNTLRGPYAGMFWSDEGNFIVIACKGNGNTLHIEFNQLV